MVKIGNIELDVPVVAAPLAGISNPVYRKMCRNFGAGLVVSEMISDKALHYNNKKTIDMCRTVDDEHPVSLQLFGSDPITMGEASKFLTENTDCDIIDINMGCPAPKVANSGAGSALMKDLPLAKDIIAAVVKSVDVPVTVKFRTGWDDEHINAVELANICEGEGAAAITVHGRTRQQMYAFPIDYETIAAVKESVHIPVIGNGGIRDVQSAEMMLNKTGCDAIMVAQGALGKPWLFKQIVAYQKGGMLLPDPPLEEQMQIMLTHIKKIVAYKGEKIGMREARKHAAWYLKGVRGAAAYRRKCGALNSIDDLELLAKEVIKQSKRG